MLGQVSIQSYRLPRFTPSAIRRDPASPRQNRLLAALPQAEYERLLPYLELVPLPLGGALHEAGGRETNLYFITAGVVSRSHVLADGSPTGFSITGREGAIGIAGFLGGGGTPSQAVVLSAGSAYRLPLHRLHSESFPVGALPQLLLRYTQALITQTSLTVACNRFHAVEQQLCRLILSCLDRLQSNDLVLSQELLAEMLGVRREAVTAAVGKLQLAGLIRWMRGHVAVLDRPQLEAHACECYQVVRREYDRLLPAQLQS
jgi:CRP-like cAMP-binding protein